MSGEEGVRKSNVDEELQYEGKSLYLFSVNNGLRSKVIDIVDHKFFNWFILFSIIFNSVLLAFDNPVHFDEPSEQQGFLYNFLKVSDWVFLGIFTAEMLLRIVAMGFAFNGSNSYLRDGWNFIDFAVVILGWVTVIPGVDGQFSSLRAVRVLRPLRTFKRIEGMRVMVVALLRSLVLMIDVLMLLAFMMFVFGILGMQFFGGKLRRQCYVQDSDPSSGLWQPGDLFEPTADTLCSFAQDDSPDNEFQLYDITYNPQHVPFGCPTTYLTQLVPLESYSFYDDSLPLFGNNSLDLIPYFENETFVGDYYDAADVSEFTVDTRFTFTRVPVHLKCEELSDNPNDGVTHFDNMLVAWLTMLQCISLEGWVDDMYLTWEATSYWSTIYFVLLVVSGSFFIMNLIVGVVYNAYISGTAEADNDSDGGADKDIPTHVAGGLHTLPEETSRDARAEAGAVGSSSDEDENDGKERDHSFDSRADSEVSAVSHDSFAEKMQSEPAIKGRGRKSTLIHKDYDTIMEELGAVRGFFFRITRPDQENSRFSNLIIALILLNTVIMMTEHHNQPDWLKDVQDISNTAFTIIFLVEMIMKLIALGVWEYVADNFNVFDGVVTIATVVELIISASSQSDGASAVSALRTFRLLRVFKLAKRWKTLADLIKTVLRSFSSLVYFTAILLLFVYIYAILGMQLFAGKLQGRSNFDSFGWSIVTVFQVIGGENWNDVLVDGIASAGWGSSIYFVSLFVLGNYIMLSLFLAILLANFEGDDDDEEETEEQLNARKADAAQHIETFDEKMHRLAMAKRAVEQEREPGVEMETLDRMATNASMASATSAGSVGSLGSTSGSDGLRRQKSKLSERRDAQRKDMQTVMRLNSQATDAIPIHTKSPVLGRSLFVLGETNPFRVLCAKVMNHAYFEYLIIFVIIVSSVCLGLENPSVDDESTYGRFLHYTNVASVVVFSVEAVIKIISLGFLLHQGSYLRDSWNRLDFFVVIVSIVDLSLSSGNLRFLKALRAFRVFRLVSRIEGMKVAITSLFLAIPAVFNVLLISLMVFSIFGILGVQLWKGLFFQCEMWGSQELIGGYCAMNEDGSGPWPLFLVPTGEACNTLYGTAASHWFGAEGVHRDVCLSMSRDQGVAHRANVLQQLGAPLNESDYVQSRLQEEVWRWTNPAFGSFDNVGSAVLILFEVSTMEMWPDIMYRAVDVSDQDEAPIENNTRANSLYFVFFIVVGNFFLTNLLIGVVIDTFNNMKDQITGFGFLTRRQKMWVEVKRLLLRAKGQDSFTAPRNRTRRKVFGVVEHPLFVQGINLMILLNIITMAMWYYDASQSYLDALDIANYVFLGIFIVEAVLKIIGLGFRQYLSSGWNVFDFLLVLGSIISVVLNETVLDASAGGFDPTIFRVFRILRIIRLVKSFKGLQMLLRTLSLSLPSMTNIASIMLLIFFVFSIMGVSLFAGIPHRDNLNKHANFDSLGMAMITVFRMATGESWNGIMHDCTVRERGPPPLCPDDPDVNCGSVLAVPYFVSLTVTGLFILVELFIAIILEHFENMGDMDKEKDVVVSIEDVTEFATVWKRYAPTRPWWRPWSDTDKWLEADKLLRLLDDCGGSLGLRDTPLSRVEKLSYLHDLHIPLYRRTDTSEDGREKTVFVVNFFETLMAMAFSAVRSKDPNVEMELVRMPTNIYALQSVDSQLATKYRVDDTKYDNISRSNTDIQSNAALLLATLKLQSVWRGHQIRKRMRALVADAKAQKARENDGTLKVLRKRIHGEADVFKADEAGVGVEDLETKVDDEPALRPQRMNSLSLSRSHTVSDSRPEARPQRINSLSLSRSQTVSDSRPPSSPSHSGTVGDGPRPVDVTSLHTEAVDDVELPLDRDQRYSTLSYATVNSQRSVSWSDSRGTRPSIVSMMASAAEQDESIEE